MKKKRIIGVIVVLLVIGLGLFAVFKILKKDYAKNLVSIKDTGVKTTGRVINKTMDVDFEDINFMNDKYIVYFDGSYSNIANYNLKTIMEKKGTVSYSYENDCYVIETDSTKAVYYKTIDEKGVLFKTGSNDRLIERDTLDDNTFYIVIDSNNKRKLYNPGYIKEYILKSYDSISVLDNYIILDDELIDTKGDKLGKVTSTYKIGNKYILLKGDKSYLYDLENHKMEIYNKGTVKNGYYILDDKYLGSDGEWLSSNNKDKRKITDVYYIDYSSCDVGFNIYKKNKKYNDICYQSIRRLGNKVLIGNSYEIERIAIYDNNRLIDTDHLIENAGNLIVDLGGEKKAYYNENGLVNNSCDARIIMNTDTSYVCLKENEQYFMDENLKKVSDVYDSISCFNGNCIVEKNGKFGITRGSELITTISYPNISYLYDGAFLVSRSVKNQLLLLGDNDLLTDIKYEEFKVDLDISRVVKDYDLSSIKSYIDKDPELFKRYAYVAINNTSLKPYLKMVLMNFKVIQTNKKFMDEKDFLRNLKLLKIEYKKKLGVAGAAGLYYDAPTPRIEILSDRDGVVYHEFMHFIDRRINHHGEYSYKRVCKIGDKYYNSLTADSSKCTYEELSTGSFLPEAGAESNVVRYFKNGSLAYNQSVLLYNALAYLIGEDKMNEVFYSDNSEEVLFLELNKYGVSLKDYKEFLNSINKWTNTSTSGVLKDLADSINFVTDVYYKKYNKSWADDKVFSLFMRLLINWSDYYDYTKGINLTDNELKVVKNKFPYDKFVKRINSNYREIFGEAGLFLIDGKYYLELRIIHENSYKTLMVDYDVLKDKILSSKLS